MALFGNDRSVLPSFRTTPELDSSARSPYDDLNRIERNVERNGRHLDRDVRDDRDPRDDRGDRGDRNLDRYAERAGDRPSERHADRPAERHEPVVERSTPMESHTTTPAKLTAQPLRASAERSHPLIQGLFDKLPEPESEWSLQARQKWLQTAANIFDLMYLPQGADAGEVTIRVERSNAG